MAIRLRHEDMSQVKRSMYLLRFIFRHLFVSSLQNDGGYKEGLKYRINYGWMK